MADEGSAGDGKALARRSLLAELIRASRSQAKDEIVDVLLHLDPSADHIAQDGSEWLLRRDPDESDEAFERRRQLFRTGVRAYDTEDILFLHGIENPGLRFAMREVLAHMRGGVTIHDINRLEVADDWWEVLSGWVDAQRGGGEPH